MKVVCMIPARGNSKRIPKKNIRILYDKPLVAWAIEAAKKAGCFDEIWVNSEDSIFEEISKQYDVKFYKRPYYYSMDSVNNDEFMYNFLKSVECDAVVQLLPTSPFVTIDTIKLFASTIMTSFCSAVVSIKRIQIESMYKFNPLNFDIRSYTKPSQELSPIQSYACSPMAWNRNKYISTFENNAGAYHGGGNAVYFPLQGHETIDIDTEEDWQLAEVIAQRIKRPITIIPKYFDPAKSVETSMMMILPKEGIKNVEDKSWMDSLLSSCVNIDKLIEEKGTEPWAELLIKTDHLCVTAIMQNKDEGNRKHYHNISEWWYIAKGRYLFEIEGKATSYNYTDKGDIIFINKHQKHKITSLEDGSVRIAVSQYGAEHFY